VAVLPLRLNGDALSDWVILKEGSSAPAVVLAAPLATVTVTSTTDVADGDTSSIANLMATPGADGVISLREAITAANNTGGGDIIAFNIPGLGPHTISPMSALPDITDPVAIDGTTEPDFVFNPVIELDGTNAGVGADGLILDAGNCTVQGLAINRFNGDGIEIRDNNCVVRGNFIGTDVTGTAALGNGVNGVRVVGAAATFIGGTSMGERNVVSGNGNDGIQFFGSAGGVVSGNFIGTDVNGTAGLINADDGVQIDFGTSAINVGGTAAGARNILSSNTTGVEISDGATGNLVQQNFIGTDVTGTAALGNTVGVLIADAPINLIGGTTASARNIISNNAVGVLIVGSGSTGNLVQGNFIGTDVTGTAPLSNNPGVQIADAPGNTIGGMAGGAGNLIAFNVGPGVHVISGTGNAIHRNAMHSNGGLGIDLNPVGVTPNDPGDGDAGANNRQNFPVLISAFSSGGSTTIQGTLNSMPNTMFTLEFFSNTACDPSGFGEGRSFLGSTTVTTNGSGNASFTATVPFAVPSTHFITATATDPSGNTSEFCQCIAGLAVTLQDNSNGNCVNVGGGMYTFKTPTSTFTGPAVITQNGTTINFQSGPADVNLLQGGVNLPRLMGNARLNVPKGDAQVFTIVDSNITNNGSCP
jgi:hypothetical protein